MSKERNPRIGSGLDDSLEAEGFLEELQVQAVEEVVVWQLEETMKRKPRSKILDAVRESVQGLHSAGVIDRVTMARILEDKLPRVNPARRKRG